jgi:hypothetical protein
MVGALDENILIRFLSVFYHKKSDAPEHLQQLNQNTKFSNVFNSNSKMKNLYPLGLLFTALSFYFIFTGCEEVECNPDPNVVTYKVEDKPENASSYEFPCVDEYVCICFCNCLDQAEKTQWEAKLLYENLHVVSIFKEQLGTLDGWQGEFKVVKSAVPQGRYKIQIATVDGLATRTSSEFTITCK